MEVLASDRWRQRAIALHGVPLMALLMWRAGLGADMTLPATARWGLDDPLQRLRAPPSDCRHLALSWCKGGGRDASEGRDSEELGSPGAPSLLGTAHRELQSMSFLLCLCSELILSPHVGGGPSHRLPQLVCDRDLEFIFTIRR